MEETYLYYECDKENLDKVREIAEGMGFTVSISNVSGFRYDINFCRLTSCCMDFSFDIEVEGGFDISDVYDGILAFYEGYDVSYEAYLRLGEDGHGKNGAPYEMVDVYNDMKECEDAARELADRLSEYFNFN